MQLKAGLRGKFVALNAYTRKKEMSSISELSFSLRNQKKEQIKPEQKEGNNKDQISMKM